MEFTEGSGCVYRPIRVLFDTPVYEQALQICWHVACYKSQIALMTELLRLQRDEQLSPEVTAEDMTELLVEESKRTLRVQLWEFQLENFDEDEARPLLQLVWEVNTSLKMMDVEFEARRMLSSPQIIPPQFRHPKIISQALKYASSLGPQQRGAPGSKLLGPRQVVLDVVPRVLRGFWAPPADTHLSMPSQRLSKVAVGVTKAVEDRVAAALPAALRQAALSRSARDAVVLRVQGKVRRGLGQDALQRRPEGCAARVLNAVADVAAREICELFQPQPLSHAC